MAAGFTGLAELLAAVNEATHQAPLDVAAIAARDDYSGRKMRELASRVGSVEALASLDAEPLPECEFDWRGVADADRAATEQVLAALFEHAPSWAELLRPGASAYRPVWCRDPEFRTIIVRLLARAARAGTEQWARSPRRTAAAIVWMAIAANSVTTRAMSASAADIWRWYEVSDCRKLARSLLEAQGSAVIDPSDSSAPGWQEGTQIVVRDAELLHSRFREAIVQQREIQVRVVDDVRRSRLEHADVKLLGGGDFQLRGRHVRGSWCLKSMTEEGRATVMLAVDDDPSSGDLAAVTLLALSVPEARNLVALLNDALDGPVRDPRRNLRPSV